MSRWLSYRPPAPFIPNNPHTSFLRHPRLDRGSLLRQRLQHRALAASQPCTGQCALTLQPTAAFHHRHPRLDRGPRRAFGMARGEPFGVEIPAAPSRRRPHIPAAVPRSDSHPSAPCASVSRPSPSSSKVSRISAFQGRSPYPKHGCEM